MGRKKKRGSFEESTEQISIRIPSEEAKDWRGLVLTLRAMGRYMSVTQLIREAVNRSVDEYAEEGVQWRATPPGRLPTGCDKSQFTTQETTDE